jgi:hypothetical protein
MAVLPDAFFALAMIESRLVRMFDELKAEIGDLILKTTLQAAIPKLSIDQPNQRGIV